MYPLLWAPCLVLVHNTSCYCSWWSTRVTPFRTENVLSLDSLSSKKSVIVTSLIYDLRHLTCSTFKSRSNTSFLPLISSSPIDYASDGCVVKILAISLGVHLAPVDSAQRTACLINRFLLFSVIRRTLKKWNSCNKQKILVSMSTIIVSLHTHLVQFTIILIKQINTHNIQRPTLICS